MYEEIEVELVDGCRCHLSPAALDYFLSLNIVRRFKRTAGWVFVEKDSLRAKKMRGHSRSRCLMCDGRPLGCEEPSPQGSAGSSDLRHVASGS